MTLYNQYDNAPMLIQNGKTAIDCKKCGCVDIPHIQKSHVAREQIYKVECAHCGAYIKFINENQVESGIYKK